MKDLKKYITVQLVLFGEVILASPLRAETSKAYCIEIPNGKYLGKTSETLWIPKSIVTETEKSSDPDSDNVVFIDKQIRVPEWFVIKNGI